MITQHRLSALKNLTLSGLGLIILSFFVYLMLRIIMPYTSGATDIDFLETKQHIIHLKHYRWAFYLHIFSSLWLLGSGLTQFSGYILRHFPYIHRFVGKVYVAIILFFSGPSALIMAYYANGGWIGQISFISLSLLWWWVTLKSYRAIRQHHIKQHGAWMIRSYALTLSAITLRIMQFFIANFTDIEAETAYQIIALPSWVFNLLIAEFIIQKTDWLMWIYGKKLDKMNL